jgi:hypothetical protein
MARKTPPGQVSKPKNAQEVVVRKAAAQDEPAPGPQPGPITPKIIWKDQREMLTHLFKGQVATATKYDKHGSPKLREIEHVHHFHSHNSNGVEQKHCHPVCGHVHEWSWGTDDAGNLIAKCGPPLKKVVRPGANGINRVSYEPVKLKIPDDQTGEIRHMTDNHSHTMTYLGTDKITPEKIQQIQQSNVKTLGQAQGVTVIAEPTKPEGYKMVDAGARGQQE